MNPKYKNYIEIAVAIGVVYLLYLIVKNFKGVLTDFSGDAAATEALQEQINPTIDQNKLQYPRWQYTAWANALENALLFGAMNEDEEAINNILFQINSDNDMAQLISDFGVRTTKWAGMAVGDAYDLPTAINVLTPELVEGFNWHYAGFNMKFRF